MTNTELRDFYEKRKSVFSDSLQVITKKINIISNVRLAVALLFIVLVYFGFSNYDLLYSLPVVLFAFILLVRRHASLFEKKTHIQHLKHIQQDEVRILDCDFSNNSSGSEFVSAHHPYTHDLDIFGEGSLFQYLNRTSTPGGKKFLARWLSSRPPGGEEIRNRQESIKELAAKTDFRQEIEACGRQIDEQPGDQGRLDDWLSHPAFIFGRPFYRIILKVLPPVTITVVIVAFFVDGLTGYAVLAAGIQWVITGLHIKRVNAFHHYISHKKTMLEKYASMLFYIRKEDYTSGLLRSLGGQAQEADIKVKQLASLVSAFDARLNSMTNLFVNSLLLYDLQCVYRLEQWKEHNAARLTGWLDTTRQMEALCSLGTFAFNHPQFVFSGINGDQTLSARAMGHPLLDEEERVTNDVSLDSERSIMIITGANMAGKSTFLRSLGVNVVLALSGAPVCAEEFHCPVIDVRSGMRTADSLKENQSYFFAELNRLKSIMDELRKGTPLLILLDEILKGTNSTDKQAGSVALVKQLAAQPCLTLIATHDLGLGELENVYPGKITNYCFEANIENDQLSFDYKLKRGLAQKMNATFLMEKMGITPPTAPEGESAARR